ncbi:poly(ethylene terephthalate) hydrolase family protein [Nocardia sp. bgisy118]|uniref:poly(ethylene terephthalate) hydrolase family protein n=1 Tax=Nocardia sp. bgisy118 TaxID=3413786 RepID=UPI003F4A663E
MTRTNGPRRAAAALLIAAATLVASQATGRAGDAPTVQEIYNKPGPHPVATAVRTDPCQESIAGMVAHIAVHLFGNAADPTCTQAFPYGLQSPIGVNTYYPADIAELPSAPLLVFTPGINANPGMYDALAKRFAEQGFVVVIPYDFFNSLAYVPALGVAVAVLANRDPNSPLFGRIDLGRTVFGGHSAGGQAALQAATVFPAAAPSIDPALRVAGVLAIEPGPLALGAAITVPTLFLTGYNDFVVPDFAWVRWWQYDLMAAAPAWIANARGVTHFSPVDGIEHYRSAGAAIAWLRHLALGDAEAASWFTGPNWRLPADQTYFSVHRNARADALN